jgi:hypothetical protein
MLVAFSVVGFMLLLLFAVEEIRRSDFSGVVLPADYGGTTVVNLIPDRGVLVVPLKMPDGSDVYAIVDSGAADVSLPKPVVDRLITNKIITPSDYLETQDYQLADGSVVRSDVYRLQTLQVGDLVVEGVRVSVAERESPPLLGQSFFQRFHSWSIDNKQRKLVIVPITR